MFLHNYVEQMLGKKQGTEPFTLNTRGQAGLQQEKRKLGANQPNVSFRAPKRTYHDHEIRANQPAFQDHRSLSSLAMNRNAGNDIRTMGTNDYKNGSYYKMPNTSGFSNPLFSSAPVKSNWSQRVEPSKKEWTSKPPLPKRAANDFTRNDPLVGKTVRNMKERQLVNTRLKTSMPYKNYEKPKESHAKITQARVQQEKEGLPKKVSDKIPFPDGVVPTHPQTCLNRLLRCLGKECAVFHLDYDTEKKSFAATCKLFGNDITYYHNTLYVAREMCAERVFLELISNISKGICTQKVESEIGRCMTELCLFKTLSIWRKLDYSIPNKLWPSNMRIESSTAERRMKRLEEHLMKEKRGEIENVIDVNDAVSKTISPKKNVSLIESTKLKENEDIWDVESPKSFNLCVSDSEASDIADKCQSSDNDLDEKDMIDATEEHSVTSCTPKTQMKKAVPIAKDAQDKPQSPKLKASSIEKGNDALLDMEKRKPFKLLNNLHGAIDFHEEIFGNPPNESYRTTVTVDGATYSAEGKSVDAAKERCAIAILKANDGINVPFTPLVRLQEIYKHLDWNISHLENSSTGLTFQAICIINEKSFSAHGKNEYEAKNNCAIQILKDVHGIDGTMGESHFIKSEKELV